MSLWYPCVYCTEELHCTKYDGDGVVSFCVLGPCTDERKSNADRIRAMTDEELARYMAEVQMQRGCPNDGAMDCRDNCAVCWIDWLSKEATE